MRAEKGSWRFTMPARKPDDILDGIVKQKGKDAKFRRKLAANKGRNWLLGITLNSFAQLDEGAPLTDLDNALVNTTLASCCPRGEMN